MNPTNHPDASSEQSANQKEAFTLSGFKVVLPSGNRAVFTWLTVAALLVRLLYFACILFLHPKGFWGFDSFGYWELAENMINHQSFGRQVGELLLPDNFRTPLYPLFLSPFLLLGDQGTFIVLFQNILSSLSCGMVYLLGKEISGSKKAAVFAALILIFDVPSVVMANFLMTETLFVFLMLLSVYYLVRFFKAPYVLSFIIISGIAVALSILCRPAGVYVPFLFGSLMIYYYHQKIRKVLLPGSIFAVVLVLTLSPWFFRNQQTHGEIFISTSRDFNLCSWHAANIIAQKHQLDISTAQQELWDELYHAYDGDPRSEWVKFSSFRGEASTKIILDHPWLFIKQQAVSIGHLLLKPMRGYIDQQLGLKQGYHAVSMTAENKGIIQNFFQNTSSLTIILVLCQIILLLIVYAAFFPGLLLLLKNNGFFALLLVLLIVYFINLTLPPTTYARYRVPVMPFIAIVSGIGLNWIWCRLEPQLSGS